MGYTKYVLSKTGWFPRFNPCANDVLEAANKVFEIKLKENGYYYIFPDRYNIKYLRELVNIFASNGVILRPYKSHHYRCICFRVPNYGQTFMHDVHQVYKNRDNFHKVMQEYNNHKQRILGQKLINMFAKRK